MIEVNILVCVKQMIVMMDKFHQQVLDWFTYKETKNVIFIKRISICTAKHLGSPTSGQTTNGQKRAKEQASGPSYAIGSSN